MRRLDDFVYNISIVYVFWTRLPGSGQAFLANCGNTFVHECSSTIILSPHNSKAEPFLKMLYLVEKKTISSNQDCDP